ncbi:transmembrane protein, putative (macronuclear) [Tetrahymena thermophila SB210]|uniref:Transmembrane protein, putative n=1 Tax=Tetrahymena thermophila (strain SB210) TaxID=312017 RepID=Q23AL6_TETTS|nr:transmembrane protein, putative [Tetrahymena thermophila SB210]EAR93476.2 transmembrane protein, putative [Tetrahymena thermophila SB210]|eukprot:XP_001013721.2 transmembrane protein, putative [Tetrahymena thermophila SB210]
MKTIILLIAYAFKLLIVRAIDVLPIQIQNSALFIKETNSVIYKASSDSTYRYSTFDTQGIITATYMLNGIRDIEPGTRYFIDNILLIQVQWYLAKQGMQKFLLNIRKLVQAVLILELSKKCCRQSPVYEWNNISNTDFISQHYYLTKVETTNSIFKDVYSVQLNNPIHYDQLLVSDISFIVAYDFQQNAFRYFDVQNLSELQSTGVTLPFIDQHTFLQYKNTIFIGTSQYVLTYISSSNKVKISLSENTSQYSYSLPNYHIFLYAISYSFTYQVFQGSDQKLVNIKQTHNFCDPSCIRCNSITACNLCSSPLYLDSQFQCVFTCPNQFVPSNSNINCVCRSNSTLQNQSCPCNTSYVDINGNCLPCPQYCNTCTSQTTCSNCQNGYLLSTDGTCVSTCPTNFIPDQTNTYCVCRLNSTQSNQSCPCNTSYVDINGNCLPCPQYCKTCTSQTTCSICQTGYLLAANGTCVSTCPTNFISDQTNTYCVCRLNSTQSNQSCPCNTSYVDINGNCLPCPQYCNTCTSQTTCSICQTGYLLAANSTCVSTCPTNFIPNQTNTYCVCRLNSTQSNLQCPCNTGYIDVNGDCKSCPSNCDVCTSQTVCFQCSINYYLTVQQTCVFPCPQTFIIDSASKKCVCGANRTLQNNLCPCNSSYVDINGDCQPCSSNCLLCTSQTSCTICQQSHYLTSEMTCVAQCPLTFVVNANQTKCICDTNRTLTNNKCVCNSGFIEIDGICQSCPQNCSTCSSQKICTVCQIGYYLTADGICTQSCPLKFIVNSTQTKCVCDINRTLTSNLCLCSETFIEVDGICQLCPQNSTNVLHAKMDAFNVLAHLHLIVCNTLIVVNNLNMTSYHKPVYNVYGIFKQENVQILVKINNFMIHKNNFAHNVFIMMENAKVNVLMVFTLTILFNVNSVIHNVNHVMGLIVINVLAVNYHLFYKMTVVVLSVNQENSQINNKRFVKNAMSTAQPALDRIQITVYLAYKIKFYQKIIKSA